MGGGPHRHPLRPPSTALSQRPYLHLYTKRVQTWSTPALRSDQAEFVQHFPWGFPGSTSGKEPACQCRRHKRHRFDPWVGKIPWRRVWQPIPVFMPGESQRNLVGYSPWVAKSRTRLKRLNIHALPELRLLVIGEKLSHRPGAGQPRGRPGRWGLSADLTPTHSYISQQKQAQQRVGLPGLVCVFPVVCSSQCRQPTDYPPSTSHQAWPSIISCLLRNEGLSQWQDQGVPELGK